MTLGQLQEEFAFCLGQLLVWAHEHGFPVRMGECWRTPEQAALNAKTGAGIARSVHIDRLAVDLNRVVDNALSENPADYRPLGEHWKTLHALARWGGDFTPTAKRPHGDIYHFSFTYGGRS